MSNNMLNNNLFVLHSNEFQIDKMYKKIILRKSAVKMMKKFFLKTSFANKLYFIKLNINQNL